MSAPTGTRGGDWDRGGSWTRGNHWGHHSAHLPLHGIIWD